MVWCPKAVAARSGFLGGSLLPVSRPSIAVGYGDDLNSLILDSIHNRLPDDRAAGLTPGDRLDRSIIERLDTLGDL